MERSNHRRLICTHLRPDLDAVASIWAVIRLMLRVAPDKVRILFKPANFNGNGLPKDAIIVDIDCPNGIKGRREGNRIHSCFETLVGKYATDDEKEALKFLVMFIDAQDTYGNAMEYWAPDLDQDIKDMVTTVALGATLRTVRRRFGDDTTVTQWMFDYIDDMFQAGLSRGKAAKEAAEAEIMPSGKVALVRNPRYKGTVTALFRRGIEAVVYVYGKNIGVQRNNQHSLDFRADDPEICKVITEAGEGFGQGEELWYAHPAGFLLAHGTEKAPRRYHVSKVDPEKLAFAVDAVVAAALPIKR